MILSNQVKEHLKGPKSAYAGSRDKDFNCDIVRVIGAIATGHDTVKFYIAEVSATKTVENFRSNKLVNLSTTNIFTTESYQLKGKILSIRPADDADQKAITQYMHQFDEAATMVGLPAGLIVDNLPHSPALVIEFVVDQVFDQTPKVGTGKTLEAV